MTALYAIALVRMRECLRRSFAPVVVAVVTLLALASRALLAFTFGDEASAIGNLAVSAAFLAGLLHAAFLVTGLLDRDLERGTLALVLTKPTGRGTYLAGTYIGVSLSATVVYACSLAAVAALLLPLPGGVGAIGRWSMASAALRGLPAVLVLHALALLCSTILPRQAGAPALLLLFAASSMFTPSLPGALLPDFSVFAVETAPASAPSAGALLLYTVAHGAATLTMAYLVLTLRAPLRGRG